LAFHHAALMLMSFLTIFGLIRLRSELNIISFVGVCGAAFFSCLVSCVEFIAISLVRNKAILLLKGLKARNMRNTIAGKVIRSLWVVKMDMGQPFYTIKDDSVLIYVERLTGFLMDALVTFPA